MTNKTEAQPEALRLAGALEESIPGYPLPTLLESEAAAEPRRYGGKGALMNDPRLLAVKATISYKSDDGYQSTETLGSMRQGVDDPVNVLAATVREASRLLALFGYPERAQVEVDAALGAIAAWRSARTQAQPTGRD